MAGARTALETSGAAAYYDPAGLAGAPQTRLDLGMADVGSSLAYNRRDAGSDGFAAGTLSLVLPLPGKLSGAAFGLYGFFPGDDLGHIVSRDAATPQFLQPSGIHRFVIFSGLGYRLGPVALGVGLQLLNSAQGSLDLSEDLGAATIGSRTLTLDLLPRISPVAGIDLDATSELRIAASYRGASQVGLTLPSNVDLGPLAFDLQLAAVSLYRPPTWTVALAWHQGDAPAKVEAPATPAPTPFEIDAEISWLQWSQLPDPALAASFTPSSALLPSMATVPPQLGLSDTLVARVGGRLHVAGPVTAMAGYAYVPTPVPAQTGPTNLLDCTSHDLALGVSIDFDDPLDLSSGPVSLILAGQYQILVARSAVKSDPLDLHGDGSYGGSLWLASASLAFRFGGTK